MIKYYYIDDEIDSIQSIADAINITKKVFVEIFPLKEYLEFEKLTDKLKLEWDSIGGLILDLKLNGGGPNSTKYTATSLAQWISSYVVTEGKPAKPLVLLSNDLKCANYSADVTSHDLFDIVKERNCRIQWDSFAELLAICANDYDTLNKDSEKNLFSILQNDDIDISSTYFAPFTNPAKFNVRQFASFVLNDLFIHPGLLISEELLAARLGIDIEKSGSNWIKFKKKYFGIARYQGIFSAMEERYWSNKAITIFNKVTGGKTPASIPTRLRVEALKEAIDDANGLIAYEPSGFFNSPYCWAIDEVTRKPLDSSEGFMIYEEAGLKAWQEPRFLSFETIESGTQCQFSLIPSEKERFVDLLSTIEENGEEEL